MRQHRQPASPVIKNINQRKLNLVFSCTRIFIEGLVRNKNIKEVSREDGFTLVEALIAGTLSLCLVIPAYALLSGAYRSATLINSRFQRDAQARQILTLLGEGTASFGTLKNARGFTMVEGIRSRQFLPQITWNLNSNGQFVMADTAANIFATPPSIAGDAVSSITVTCGGNALPLPGCSTGAKLTTKGWMGADPVLLQTGGTYKQIGGIITQVGGTVAVDITVSDPFQATRPGQTAAGVTDTYRTLFNLNVEADP
jgi:type II secretory pathway component PulJ